MKNHKKIGFAALIVAILSFVFCMASCDGFGSKPKEENKVTLTFDLDGGTGIETTIEEDPQVVFPYPNSPTKDGYIFKGWDPELPQFVPTEDTTYTAVWVESVKTYCERIGKYTEKSDSSVTFGSFPKTIKADGVTITTISETISGVRYYFGDDDCWYIETKEDGCTSNLKYSNGKDVQLGGLGYKQYFKVEPIEWDILTEDYSGKKLLLAKNILTATYYDKEKNKYEESSIRYFLENDFMNIAFTESQQEIIAVTVVDNSAASTNGGTGAPQVTEESILSNNTNDKIFLLSTKEVTTEAYGFKKDANTNDSKRWKNATDYAKAKHSDNTHWWLRSPIESSYIRCVYGGYAADNSGSYNKLRVEEKNNHVGVVPALCVTK